MCRFVLFFDDRTDLPGQRRGEIHFQQPWLQSIIYEHVKAIQFWKYNTTSKIIFRATITQSHSTPIRGLETQSVSSKHRPTSSRKASLPPRTAEGALSIPTRHCCPEFHTVRQHTRPHCADGWRVRGVEQDLTNATRARPVLASATPPATL